MYLTERADGIGQPLKNRPIAQNIAELHKFIRLRCIVLKHKTLWTVQNS
jgi:hypothetical protein